MEFRILGQLEVLDEGRPIALGGSRQRALLALLLVHAGETLSTDRLIDELWGERPPVKAAKTVQMQISRLRKALAGDAGHGSAGVVVTRERGYQLVLDPDCLDAHRFERLVAEGGSELAAGRPQRAFSALEQALALWRGRPLDDLAYEPFVQREIARLDDLRVAALEQLVDAKLGLGRHAEVVAQLERLIAKYPYRERLRSQLMLALYRCDRQADALQAYQDARRTLVEQLGIEPGERLRELERAILAQDPALVAPAMESTTADRGDVPSPPTDLPSGVVTFLLTDIEGSSGLWEADPGGMAAALDLHDELIAHSMEAHGGRLLKMKGEGDSTVTAFRRASDAVAAAVVVQEAFGAASWPGELKLRVRIAVHTGEAHERQGDYFGPALNRAARLRALARGGATFVSQATAEIVHDRLPRNVELVDLGRHQLRGLSRAENVFELRPVAAQAAPEPAAVTVEPAVARPAPEVPRDRFVGRERELRELVAGLDDAVGGHGRLFLLAGEPGIGKSRLAEELMARARARGVRVLVGRCWEAGGAPAYWPWVQSLRGYVRETEPEVLRAQLGPGAADLAQIVPELRERFADLPQPPSLESEQARFRLFDATAEFLRTASSDQPILLVLDDLHAADAPSLLLLQFVTRELGPARMLMLGVYRDVDPVPQAALTEMLAAIVREPVTHRLHLDGLSEREIAQYVELTAAEIASPALVAALHDESEGNPLFVGEIVSLLSLEGVRAEPTGQVRLALPQTVRDVIGRRLSHLSEECSRVLRLASVLGREFALDALALLAGMSEDQVLDTLDEAMAAKVVSDVPGGAGRLRFAHILIRDTLYEGLAGARRVRLHRKAVEVAEALYGDEPGPRLAELAHHAVAGSDFEKAHRYARRAGDRGLALLAYEEAARLYETALDALDRTCPLDDTSRCQLLLSLGEAEARAGNTPAAKDAFLAAAGLARELGLPRELAQAAAGYGGRIIWGRAADDIRLVPLLEEGLAALGEDRVELRIRLLARLAGALRDDPTRARRDALSREAVQLARRAGNRGALAYALEGRAAVIVAPDTIAECLALSSELCEVAEQIGERERLVQGLCDRIIAHLQLGHIRAAELDLDRADGIAQELRQPAHLWQVSGVRAMLALAAGSMPEAEQLVARALSLGRHTQPRAAIPVYRLQQYALCDFGPSLEQIEPDIRDLVDQYAARPVFRCVLAHLHARLGRTAEAKRAHEKLAQDGFSGLPFDQEWLYGMTLLAETSALLPDADSASALYGLLLPWAGLNAVDQAEGIRGSVARYLGILAATLKRWHEAERHFEDAVAMNAQMGARPWLAHTHTDYARMLLARDHPDDRKRALKLIRYALATYRELGMPSGADEASELKRALHVSPAARR
jgi:DNA-binding SARP family transcriptional activator